MQHSIRKVIKKSLDTENVYDALKEKFQDAGKVSHSHDVIVTGFKKKAGGKKLSGYAGFCVTTATFSAEQKKDKTILTAEINIRPSFFYLWLTFPVSLLLYSVGKSSIINAVENGVQEVVDELE